MFAAIDIQQETRRHSLISTDKLAIPEPPKKLPTSGRSLSDKKREELAILAEKLNKLANTRPFNNHYSVKKHDPL